VNFFTSTFIVLAKHWKLISINLNFILHFYIPHTYSLSLSLSSLSLTSHFSLSAHFHKSKQHALTRVRVWAWEPSALFVHKRAPWTSSQLLHALMRLIIAPYPLDATCLCFNQEDLSPKSHLTCTPILSYYLQGLNY